MSRKPRPPKEQTIEDLRLMLWIMADYYCKRKKPYYRRMFLQLAQILKDDGCIGIVNLSSYEE